MVMVGYQNANTGWETFHPDDDDRDGIVSYHYDCPSEWHTTATANDPAFGKIVALATSGIHDDELRLRLESGDF